PPLVLNGIVYDDGLPNPVTVHWTQISGTGTVIFGSDTAVSTTATFPNTGDYVLRLTATDGATTLYDDVNVQRFGEEPNQAPVVNGGHDQATAFPSGVANLVGSATDDGLPNPPGALTYQWSVVSGPGTATFGTPTQAATSATFSAAGTYVLRLTASDTQ